MLTVHGNRSISRAAAALCTGLALTGLTACSGSDEADDPASPDAAASGPECITDITTPTETYAVGDADHSSTKFFLTADTAVVQTGDGDPVPVVLGGPGPLQDALHGTRVWAVTKRGFVVDTNASNDPEAPLVLLDAGGKVLAEGPTVGQIDSVSVVGDQLVVNDYETTATYDVDTLEPSDPEYDDEVAAVDGFVSSITLTDKGTYGSAIDTGSGEEFSFDTLLENGVEDNIGLAAVGSDRVLLMNQEDDPDRAQFWTWDSDGGLKKSYSSADEGLYYGNAAAGICGSHLYLAEYDELKVIDTSDGDKVVSRRPFPIDGDDDVRTAIIAVPGGLIVSQYDDATRSFDVLWFD